MPFLRPRLLQTLSFVCGSSFILGRNQLAIAAQTAVHPKTSPLPAGAAARLRLRIENGGSGLLLPKRNPRSSMA
jgi:hypothetical protein